MKNTKDTHNNKIKDEDGKEKNKGLGLGKAVKKLLKPIRALFPHLDECKPCQEREKNWDEKIPDIFDPLNRKQKANKKSSKKEKVDE